MNDIRTLNDLFKELYASKITQLIPSGVLFKAIDYYKMGLEELSKHTTKEAREVYAMRTSKLGRYLEGDM